LIAGFGILINMALMVVLAGVVMFALYWGY
jgi:hypothetical protein